MLRESAERRPAPPPMGIPCRCFVGHEKFDLLWQGKKIAGAAQRRNRFGLLIQGSVQPPPGPQSLQRADWVTAMAAVAAEQFRAVWAELTPAPELLRRAEALAAQKYSQADYNQRR